MQASSLVELNPASEVACPEPQNNSPVKTALEASHVPDQPATVELPTEQTVLVAVQTRTSKRPQTQTIKYTPPAPPVKKQKGKKGGSRAKKISNKVSSIHAAPSGAATTPTEQSGFVVIETKLPPILEKPSCAATTPTKQSGSFVTETKVGPFVG